MTDSSLNHELLLRLEAGDDHAFVDLFDRYRLRLKRMLEFRMDHRLRSRADASDVLQEVYIDAHQRIAHYLKKPDLSFYVWLRQLTAQRLIDFYRRHLVAEKRDARLEVPFRRDGTGASSVASIAVQLVAHLATPSQMMMQEEMIRQIEATLAGMEDLDREVVALRHFEELRNSEVAEVLGIKEAAASNRYVRALMRLREALDDLPGFFD